MMWTVLCSSDQLMDTSLTCIIFTATMNRSLIDHNESFMGGYGNDIKRETWTIEKPWHVKRSFRSAQWPAHGDNQSGCRVWAGAMLYCQSPGMDATWTSALIPGKQPYTISTAKAAGSPPLSLSVSHCCWHLYGIGWDLLGHSSWT